LNYFSENLIFEEPNSKSMGNILDEYLDPSEYQVVSCQINDQFKKLKGENDQIN
jgi:hypothetical protein